MKISMKKILLYLTIAGIILFSSGCNDWLDVVPNNEQVAAKYWETKEQVVEAIAQGYSDMRATVPSLIKWGELRGASIYAYSGKSLQELQNFQLQPSSSEVKWGTFYTLLNSANSIIKYAPEVKGKDETYHEAVMNSHLAEAYFMRAWAYFTLVRNFKEVPLILDPYMTDETGFEVAKSSESEIIDQIKKDITIALETGGAKEFFDDDEWDGMSKGRITKWALYALMADVCLWSEDFDGCIEYADLIIKANASFRPAFVEDPEQWFEIFSPGNSNGSVFEINYSTNDFKDQDGNSPSSIYPWGKSAINAYQFSKAMCERLYEEAVFTRGLYTSFNTPSGQLTIPTSACYIWKFQGAGSDIDGQRPYKDANWIIYRMADVLLMKAEALIWKESAVNFAEALNIIDRIRTRAGLLPLNNTVDPSTATQIDMLQYLLHERDMEFSAEGKRWYDLLRFGRTSNFKYKEQFIEEIIKNNNTVGAKWIRSVLKSEDAWYLPIYETEIENNPLLTQNPYYGETTVN